jgi:elongation factor 1 alpha-like protein
MVRFPRGLTTQADATAEMEEDSEEEEEGMTAEQKGMPCLMWSRVWSADNAAQLATSMPIARALLKDVKPPISDTAIADSLWHYWFDVDKAVAWLRKDWEKKGKSLFPPLHHFITSGVASMSMSVHLSTISDRIPAEPSGEATIPSHLEPTPDQQPRRKGSKRQRVESPELPLTALQRLSLARKTSPPSISSPGPSTPTLAAATPEGGKPKSKLALLAEQRRLASAKGSPSQANATASPAPSTSTPPPADASPSKPLSKLAQKMAAARAAKADGAAKTPTSEIGLGEPSQMDAINGANDEEEIDEVDTTLFPATTPKPPAQSSTSPSTFFNVLTSTHRKPLLPSSELSMHLPAIGDADELQRRIRTAFGEGVESPDDIILRARSGRAGITAPAAIDSKT